MTNYKRKDKFKSFREWFTLMLCCGLIRTADDDQSGSSDNNNNTNKNNDIVTTVLSDAVSGISIVGSIEDYPEQLNPFADDTDDELCLDTEIIPSMLDYPDYLNPFSDDQKSRQ